MNIHKKLKRILKEMKLKEDGISSAPTNAVAAHGTTIAGASPGEMPPVNLKKRKKSIMGYVKRNPPQM